MFRLVFLVAFIAIAGASYENKHNETVTRFWSFLTKDVVNSSVATVGEEELSTFFKRYDNKVDDPTTVNIYEDDFVNGPRNWAVDMVLDWQASIACFKLLDLTDLHDEVPDKLERMTDTDVSLAVMYSDEDFDGILSEKEFRDGYGRLLRPLPFGVLYLRYRTENGSGNYDDYVFYFDWMEIYKKMGAEDQVTEKNVAEFWTDGGYGNAWNGQLLHKRLDLNHDGILTVAEWESWYSELDSNFDFVLDYEEFLQLDYILYEGGVPTAIPKRSKITPRGRLPLAA